MFAPMKANNFARAIAAAMIASTLLAGLANASGSPAKEKGKAEEGEGRKRRRARWTRHIWPCR
ncbi:MAG: hypothetical protein M0D54_09830 [Hyphomonadaceae bacterium JAD_PAG50586_4]|nr:MAG: hypothetical protein M0D54_09830 [Hyphomonadaceae bacterium JAD_PAG50586_4]